MNSRTGVAVTAVLAVALGMSASHAQSSAAARTRAFAALPDWTGLWETEISVAVLNGETATQSPTGQPATAQPQTK